MGRKLGGNKKGGGFGPSHHQSATLRQQRSGIKIDASKNVPSVLRLEHLKNLAYWAGGEASIPPPLAALFGHRLSSAAEEIGIPLDASLFPCQRCETVLRPGHNCIVRIEKNKTKKQKHRQREQLQPPTQNNIVYHCNFCLHKNAKRGTRKSYMKELYSSSSKQESNVDLSGKPGGYIMQGVKLPEMELLLTEDLTPEKCSEKAGEKTPILLSTKKRQHIATCNRGSGNYAGSSKNSASVLSCTSKTGKGGSSSSTKRKKGWTSLKEIAEKEAHYNTRSSGRLPIPFLL